MRCRFPPTVLCKWHQLTILPHDRPIPGECEAAFVPHCRGRHARPHSPSRPPNYSPCAAPRDSAGSHVRTAPYGYARLSPCPLLRQEGRGDSCSVILQPLPHLLTFVYPPNACAARRTTSPMAHARPNPAPTTTPAAKPTQAEVCCTSGSQSHGWRGTRREGITEGEGGGRGVNPSHKLEEEWRDS